MYIKNISLNSIKKIKKVYYYIFIAIIIILSLVIIYVFNYKKDITQNSNLFIKDQIFNIDSYYTNYQATIVSNKNINSYLIDEWYKSNIGHRINFRDKMGNSCSYIMVNGVLQIKSYNQKNILKIEEYTSDNMNILSILTYIEIFNSLKYNNQCCNIEYKNINNEKHITITSSGKNNNQCKMCELCEKNKYVYSLELVLNNYNTPIRYNIKDKNKNDRISIIYNKFQFNQKIDNTIFSI